MKINWKHLTEAIIEERDLTHKGLSESLGVSEYTVNSWMVGRREPGRQSRSKLRAIAVHIGLDLSEYRYSELPFRGPVSATCSKDDSKHIQELLLYCYGFKRGNYRRPVERGDGVTMVIHPDTKDICFLKDDSDFKNHYNDINPKELIDKLEKSR